MLVPIPADPVVGEFVRARGKQIDPKTVEWETVCPSLRHGRCDRWKTRPTVCAAYKAGGKACRDSIWRRRPAHARAILALL